MTTLRATKFRLPLRALAAAAFLALAATGACTSGPQTRSDLQVSDAWINTRAENEVGPVLEGGSKVQVSTQDGVVFLDGFVSDIEQAEQLEIKVSKIRGVREVKNNLVVKQ